MKKVITLILVLTIIVSAWEINTHRAIDRKAIEASENLKNFVKNSGIPANSYFYNNEQFEGYNKTYLGYVKGGENNGISAEGWRQSFGSEPSYQKMLEAGTILEDAQWPHTVDGGEYNYYDITHGRFNNHFYDAQNGGHKLTWTPYPNVNAVDWANNLNVPITNPNLYNYPRAMRYFKLGFTESDPALRRKYQAKMLVSVGHILHMVNDINVPAHVRDDTHPSNEPLEIWARGGEEGRDKIGFRVLENTLEDYSELLKRNSNEMIKYNNFNDFMTKEATWTATQFFSDDTVFSKPLPSVSTTYEDFIKTKNDVDMYYIRSYGNGTWSCTDGCIPEDTRLAIHIKSYITRGLRRYYTGSQYNMIDNSTTFQGEYSVITDNAKILIPRAIANARNFVNYFFRGQISAKIDGDSITITNESDPSLVKDMDTVTIHPGTFHIKYSDKDDTSDDAVLHEYLIKPDCDRIEAGISDVCTAYYNINGFRSFVSLKPGESIVIPTEHTTSIIHQNIIVLYDGNIGDERGLAICKAQTPFGVVK